MTKTAETADQEAMRVRRRRFRIWSWVALFLVSLPTLVLAQDPGRRRSEEEPLPWQEGSEQEEPQESEPAEASAVPQPTAYRADRINFEVPFPPEKGGGVAVGTAGNLEYVREDYVVASGGVELRFRDYIFQGERVAVDLKQEQITAEGDVILDQGPKRLVGDTLFFDIDTGQGTMTNAKAYVDPDIFFEGREITRLAEDRYRVTDGMLTSCLDDNPDWNFRLSRAEVELEGFAKVRHGRFRVKKLPLLYSPYLVYPAKTERTSGFLFPNLGYSERRGAHLGLAWFQTLGDSYDTTLYVDLYSNEYYAFGNEWRYQPSPYTRGFFEGYVVDDPESDESRWKVFWTHKSDRLPLGFTGVVRYEDFSDFDFFQDFERDFNNVTIRRLLSAAFLTGSWGQHSVNLLVDQNETFIREGDIATTRQLPEAEYRLRAYQIGSLPMYFDLVSSASYLNSERTDRFENRWQRADLFPSLRASLSTLPWLSVAISGGQRVTWYSTSFDEITGDFDGDALTRSFPTASSAIVGPSFSRVFDAKIGRFAKFKHIIEPRWDYFFLGEFDDQDLIPRFDEIDRFTAGNLVAYNFVNRLLAKPEDEENGGGAREIMSLEISQLFSLDADKPLQTSQDGLEETARGPLAIRYRFNPSRAATLEAKVSHNTLFNNLNDTALSGAIGIGQHGVGLTWFTRFNPETGDKRANQLRFFTGINLWPNRLRVDAQVNYDFQTSLLQSQRYILQYFSQCYGFRVELRQFETIDREDREYRFALTLKNIGTFLDLTGGTSNGFNPGF